MAWEALGDGPLKGARGFRDRLYDACIYLSGSQDPKIYHAW